MKKPKKKGIKVVLFSSFGPPALAFIRSLSRKRIKAGMICIQGNENPTFNFKKNDSFVSIAPESIHTHKGMVIICDYLNKFKATGITCIDENIACWLNHNSDNLPTDLSILLPRSEVIESVLSKVEQIEMAKAVGMQLLPILIINNSTNFLKNIAMVSFPICVRPSEPFSVYPNFKVKILSSMRELEQFIREISRIEKPIIAQPFLNLPNLVVHGSRKTSGEIIGLQGFLVDRKFEGLTLTIKPFELSEDLKKKCKKFTELMEILGPYHFEFLYDEKTGDAWFLELNNRLGGTTAKVFALGYDEPGYLLQSFGYDISVSQKIVNRTASSKIALLKYLYYTLINRITQLDYPADESKTRRIFETIKALLFYKDDILSLRDFKGALLFYISSIRQKLNI